MNTRRFDFLSQVLTKFIKDPDCIPVEKVMQYQKEYNDLLMQKEAETNKKQNLAFLDEKRLIDNLNVKL